jgi:hypothetical protein
VRGAALGGAFAQTRSSSSGRFVITSKTFQDRQAHWRRPSVLHVHGCTSVIGRPGLLDNAGAVAQGELGARPAFDRGGEASPGEQEVVHAGEVLVEVQAGGVVPTVDAVRVVGHGEPYS